MAKKTKAVFLYGKPTGKKMKELLYTQELYRRHVNFFIEAMSSDKAYFLDLLNNNKKSPAIRGLEKENRTELGSAYGQNAVDHAVKELHNHLIRIKNHLYGMTVDTNENYFASSTALLNASIQGHSCKEAVELIEDMIRSLRDKDKKTRQDEDRILFYEEILSMIKSHKEEDVSAMMRYMSSLFFIELESRKVPFLKNVPLQLDSRLCTIERAESVKADFVLCVKAAGEKARIEIPVSSSRKGVRRLMQYGMKSPSVIITPSGVKVSVPFEKKIKNKSENKTFIGVDSGITDLLYDSKGNSFGEYSKVVEFYNEKVIPEDAKLNSLRSLMKRHQSELRDRSTHPKRKKFLRKKICNINTLLQSSKKANRIRRSYKSKQIEEISRAVNGYLDSIKGSDVTTVIEDLDIRDFKRGKENNRRDSLWARGMLHKKLQEKLEWEGYSVVKVDPAYTSKACPVCHSIHDGNRNFKQFKCVSCGHISDADHNASVNIRDRATDSEIKAIVEKHKYSTKKRHAALKELYAKRHEDYNKTVA